MTATFQVVRSIIRPLQRRWRIADAAVLPLLALPVGLAGVAGVVLGFVLDQTGTALPRTSVTLAGLMVMVSLLTALSAIFSASAFAQSEERHRWWASMPVSDRALAVARATPVWYFALLQAVAFGTAFARFLGGALGGAQVVLVTFVAVLGGVVTGRVLLAVTSWALAGRSTRGQGRAQTWSVPGAIVFWVIVGGALGWWARSVISLSIDPDSLLLGAPLGVPGVVHAALHELSGTGLLSLALAAAGALIGEWWCWGRAALPARGVGGVVLTWPRYRGGPVVVAEILRLVRSRRVQALILSLLTVLALLAALMTWAPGFAESPSSLDNAAFVLGVLASYPAILARGRSGVRPYALLLGLEPARWGMTVAAAGWVVGMTFVLLGSVVLAVALGDPGVQVHVLALGAFMVAVGALAGSVLHASEHNPAAETIAAGAVAAITLGAGRAVAALGAPDGAQVAGVLALLAPVLLVCAGVVERQRWNARPRRSAQVDEIDNQTKERLDVPEYG